MLQLPTCRDAMTRIYIPMSVCNAGAPFCSQEVPKPTSKPAPEVFYCRNSAKYAKTPFDEKLTCSDVIDKHIKPYWDIVKHELDSPDAKRFFTTCCDPASVPENPKKTSPKTVSPKPATLKPESPKPVVSPMRTVTYTLGL